MPKHDVSFIANGKYYPAFEEIPEDECLEFMKKYRTKLSEPQTIPYYQGGSLVNPPRRGGRRRMSNAEREIAQMQAEARQQEELAAEVDAERQAEEERLKPILEHMHETYKADVSLQKTKLEINAQRSDEMFDSIAQEHEEHLEHLKAEGFYATGDEVEEEGTNVTSVEAEPEPETPKVAASSNGSAKPGKKSKLYCRRKGRFIPTSQVDDLRAGEDLYRLRPRKFGQAQKWIRHGTYQTK